jgi:hypothetical protein
MFCRPFSCVLLQGSCRTIDLRSVSNKEWKGDWVQLSFALNKFDWFNAKESDPFYSCTRGFGAWDINLIEFK